MELYYLDLARRLYICTKETSITSKLQSKLQSLPLADNKGFTPCTVVSSRYFLRRKAEVSAKCGDVNPSAAPAIFLSWRRQQT